MLWVRVIRLLRPGWSHSRARRRTALAIVARTAVIAFVLHLSGAAHLLSDVLLDDDMTCVDEQAHRSPPGSTAPGCPAAQGVGLGQGFVPPATHALGLPPPEEVASAHGCEVDTSPPFVAPRSIERPPRV